MEIGWGEPVAKTNELKKKREIWGCGKIGCSYNLCMNVGLRAYLCLGAVLFSAIKNNLKCND